MARHKVVIRANSHFDVMASSLPSSAMAVVVVTPSKGNDSVVREEVLPCDDVVDSIEPDQSPVQSDEPFNRSASPSAPSIIYTPATSVVSESHDSPGTPTAELGFGITPPATDSPSVTGNTDIVNGSNPSETGAAPPVDEAVQTPRPQTPTLSSQRDLLSPSPNPTPGSSRRRRRRSSSAIPLPRHEVSDEEPPNHPFHEPAFQQAFHDTKQLMVELSNFLSSGTIDHEPDSKIKKLAEDARELGNFQCPATRTVGFVGDSGMGKSSLVNSLLDIDNLAMASSATGAACTCVVTEFLYHSSPNFEIEVEYFSREELEKQLSEHLKSYRYYHQNGTRLEAEERETCKQSAKLAEDTFLAMFPRQLQEGFSRLLELAEEDALARLMSWVDLLPRSSSHRETLEDATACAERLREITFNSGAAGEAQMWPYICKVRVRSNAFILSKGLILVDLPGLRDINSARRNITERYLRKCKEIFVVLEAGRARSNQAVEAVIELANKADLSNVGIVCTKSEVINAEDAELTWQGESARVVRERRAAVASAKKDLRGLRDEINAYDDEWESLDEEEIREFHRLRRDKKEAEELVSRREFELKEFIMTTRNEQTSRDLRGTYEHQVPGRRLPVFCVSNTLYREHRNSRRDISRPLLDLSGIIQLRQHCISIVSESQLRAATEFMKGKVPALLDSLQLWVQSGSGSLDAQQKQAVHQTLDEVEARLRQHLTQPGPGIDGPEMERLFDERIRDHREVELWVQTASQAAIRWSGIHHSTYAACCRKRGVHTTKPAKDGTIQSYNWNEDVIASMASSMVPRWREFCKAFLDLGNGASNDISLVFANITGLLDDDRYQTLSSSITLLSRMLTTEFKALLKEVAADLRALGVDAFSGLQTSMVGQALEPSYDACANESGGGSDQRRKNIMKRRLGDDEIFNQMQEELEERLGMIIEDLQEKQSQLGCLYLEKMTESLDMLRDEHIILESERNPEFRNRVEEAVKKARDDLALILEHVGETS